MGRLALESGAPVVPVALLNTDEIQPTGKLIPKIKRVRIRFGAPLDFTRYAASGNDRDVLRYVTDEIMNAVMELSGQEYVDAYGTSVKSALESGRELAAPVQARPGAGRPVPPVPSQTATPPRVSAVLPPSTELSA